MKKELVIKKLKKEVARKQAELTKQGSTKKVDMRNVFSPMRYVIRDNEFKNGTDTCALNMDTMEGHSYSWYSLVKRIKGTVYLNDYRYSSSTSKHIGEVRHILRFYGIKYKCLEAPHGLQNLEDAVTHMVDEIGKATVLERYSRKQWSYRGYIKDCKKQLETLAKLGFKHTQKAIDASIESAELARIEKNEDARIKSKQYREIRKARLADEKLKKEEKLKELSGSTYAYRQYWAYTRRNGSRKRFELFKVESLHMNSERLLSLSPVPGSTKKDCLNYLKVMARLEAAA